MESRESESWRVGDYESTVSLDRAGVIRNIPCIEDEGLKKVRSDTFVNKQTRSGFRAPPSCLPVFFFSSHSVCDGQTLYCVQIFFLNLIYDLSSHFYLIYDLSFHLLPNV